MTYTVVGTFYVGKKQYKLFIGDDNKYYKSEIKKYDRIETLNNTPLFGCITEPITALTKKESDVLFK